MVNKTCELCKTRTSCKWKTITLNVAQNVLDLFKCHLEVGKFICNACQVKISKEKNKRSSDNIANNPLPIPSRGEKFLTKASIIKRKRLENFKEPLIALDKLNIPEFILQEIILNLDIKSALNLISTCTAFQHLITQSLWKKLLERDFPDIKLSLALCTRETYASIFQQKIASKNMEKVLRDKISALKNNLDKCTTSLKSKEEELNTILEPPDGRITPTGEKVFTTLFKQKQALSKDGYIYAHNSHGKPTRLMNIPKASSGSSQASSSSIRKRSVIIEKVAADISGSSSNSSFALNKDNLTQQASVISRNKEVFLHSANKAGINIVTRFDLKNVAALKAELPWEQIRMLKRAFKDSFGFDVFGSEKELRKYIGELELPFESGTYTTREGKSVSFVRISNVEFVIKQLVEELIQVDALETPDNIDSNTLYLLLPGDKGGSSTKLLLQVLNTADVHTHSNRYAKLIGIYEGDKENRECIEAVFGPLIQEIQDVSKRIKDLHLKSHKVCPTKLTLIDPSLCDQQLQINGASNCPAELLKIDQQNIYVSKDCKLCRKYSSSIASNISCEESSQSGTDSSPYNKTTKEKNCKCEFDNCLVVLGGDWLWIANVLGYTGPKGVHFCKDCLCKLSDLQKGIAHSPNPLPKYKESIPSVCNFEKRTFEQLQADHERYRASGDPRTKVKDYHNCELPSLFKGLGPIILTTSCMPLHISQGVGLRILNVVEEEAISIDNKIKTENGQQTNEIAEIMNRLQILSSEVLEKG